MSNYSSYQLENLMEVKNEEIENLELIIKAKNTTIQDLEFEIYQMDIAFDRVKSIIRDLKSDIENGE